MKIIIIFFLVIQIGAVQAEEEKIFTDLPASITKSQALAAIKKSAIRRKWTTSDLENDKLQVKLNHRSYKAWLIFSISDGNIYYQDLTTYDGVDEFEDLEEGSPTPVPSHWLKNLIKDSRYYMNEIRRNTALSEKFSPEDMEKKLVGLKGMYDKKLITEAEYIQKKKEIISRY